MGKSLVPTLNIHQLCDIIDTDGSCKPINLGCLWIFLVRIAPINNPGTKREILPYMVGNYPALPCMAIGQPHWS